MGSGQWSAAPAVSGPVQGSRAAEGSGWRAAAAEARGQEEASQAATEFNARHLPAQPPPAAACPAGPPAR